MSILNKTVRSLNKQITSELLFNIVHNYEEIYMLDFHVVYIQMYGFPDVNRLLSEVKPFLQNCMCYEIGNDRNE